MKDVVGSTSEEVRMIKAVQKAVGALDNGYIGAQTMSDIAIKVGASCWPLNVELYSQPTIIGKDIDPYNPKGVLPANAISGSFNEGTVPCSILVRNGTTVCAWACHASLGKPESVIYKLKTGKVGIARVKNVSELPSGVQWAVGGFGLLSNYDPVAEGFTGKFSDVVRKTNHTVLGVKNGMMYGVYCKNMSASEVNTFCKSKLKLELAIMLDGGHVAAINGAVNKINTKLRQLYCIKFI